ncbi:MAG: hypothetical protein R3F54_19020 [Alphaproteobacteria bacterium]
MPPVSSITVLRDFVVHGLPAGQRIVGIALGCEDVGDHGDLRHDPVLARWLAGSVEASCCCGSASKTHQSSGTHRRIAGALSQGQP